MISNPNVSASWGPLKTLVGKWVGAREKQSSPQHMRQYYEVRTFHRRSTVLDSASSPLIYPLLFTTRVFDFYDRTKQISEETGYLLWMPETRRVSQLTIQPTGIFRLECATMEEADETCCLIFNTQRDDSQILNAELALRQARLQAVESTIIYDSSTFRFDQSFHVQIPGQNDVSYREVGELVRVEP